ncbi:MAG: efflux transporter outer membrane subunit [Planctomycetales bacterium]|nr:efflux transporter outer membrane subunit [Planctomycetales bacterium]
MFGIQEATDAADNRSRLKTAARCRAKGLDRVGLLAITLAVGTLSGCASLSRWWENGFKVGPEYTEPQAVVSGSWESANDPSIRGDQEPLVSWWTQLNDPTLDGLVQTAVNQNLDLRTAGHRLMAVMAERNVAIGNLFPDGRAVGAISHAQISKNLPAVGLGTMFDFLAVGPLAASWEIEFWGKNRRAIESAEAELEASQEDCRNVQVSLVSEVATNYVQLRAYQQRIEFAQQHVQIQQKVLSLALERFQNGIATELDVQQAKSSLAETEASLPQLDTGLKQAGHRLCILLGLRPGEITTLVGTGPIPIAPTELAVGIPADLLRRRPDIRKAERQVASQCAQIGVAEADLYPSLQLLGFVGYTSNSSGTLFTAPSFTGIIAPVLQWKIFNYYKIKNNVCKQEALLGARITDYQQTVLKAHGEVEGALIAFVNSRKQAAHLGESVEAARTSVNLVLDMYREGKVDFNRVQNAQAMLIKQQDQLAVANIESILSLIRVYRGLAGGWEVSCEDSQAGYVAVQGDEDVPPPTANHAVTP